MKRYILIISSIVLLTAVIGSLLWFRQIEQPVSPVKSEPSIAKPQPPVKSPEQKKDAAEPVLLRFMPQNGQTAAYRFDMQGESVVDSAFLISRLKPDAEPHRASQPQEKNTIILKTTGELCLKFFESKPDSWNVAAFIEGLTHQLNGATPGYAKAMEFPFAFRMNSAGYISDFQFTQGIPTEAREFSRQLIYTLQTGFPSEAKTEWNARENDASGIYRAEYAIENSSNPQFIHLIKRKLEYLSVAVQNNIPDYQIRIDKSLKRISVPRQGAWLLTLEGEETTTTSSAGREIGKGSSRFSANQVLKDIGARFPDTFAQFLASINDPKYKKSKYYVTEEQFNRISAGMDTSAAIKKYLELLKSDISNPTGVAEQFFVNYLRQNPRAAFEVIGFLDADPLRERFDHSTHLILWRLITEAGHAEAQQAVIQAATDPKFSNLTHTRALLYVHDFEYPESFLVEKLWELHQNEPANSEVQDAQELKMMSLLAVGSLGYRDKLNNDIKPEIGRQLAENLKKADSPGEQAITLSAIGNYGGSEVLTDIAPFLSNSEENVRVSAYEALRRMNDPNALDLLIKSVKTEGSATVRDRAYKSFASMPPTSAGMEWAKTEVLAIENPKELESLVTVLGENLKAFPQNEEALRELLKKNPVNRVKKEIYKYIAPK